MSICKGWSESLDHLRVRVCAAKGCSKIATKLGFCDDHASLYSAKAKGGT